MRAPAAFAIPGDIRTLTGGYLYERRLLEHLRARGHDVRHIQLGAGFPHPSRGEMAEAAEDLARVAPSRPLILDGLVFGALETAALAAVPAPVVAMIHHPLALESGLSDTARRHLFATERDNLRLAARVFVPSPHTREILVGRYGADPGRISVIRPGSQPPSGPPSPADPPLILSVGILHPRKGHDVLIDALHRIRHLRWSAVIAGSAWDADHARALEHLVARRGLGGRLRLAGRVPVEELHGLYRKASLFALATRYEGYGIVFDEAMAHGLPVVSCRTGAVPDTVPPGAGLLVAPDDAAAFAAALAGLLQDPGRRQDLARAAAQAAAGAPDWTAQAEIAGQVLDGLAAECA